MKKYHVMLSFINTDKELIPEHHIINMSENYKAENVKEIKEIIKALVDGNIDDNRDWLEESVKPKVKRVDDKTYLYYNDCNDVNFWVAERCAEDNEGNIVTIVRAEAFPITKDDAIDYVRTIN